MYEKDALTAEGKREKGKLHTSSVSIGLNIAAIAEFGVTLVIIIL